MDDFTDTTKSPTSDSVDYIKLLEQRDKERGVVRRRATWAPQVNLSEQQKAKYLLKLDWERERGYYPGLKHPRFDCKWNHFSCHKAVVKAKWRRYVDRLSKVHNPFE